ncbi:MAG: hypothetical protein EA406_09365 [Rhodospirillales bacterium]|nr:MAG: hypothetical protein EA406_09365 [Rhodospirillales bacterium]
MDNRDRCGLSGAKIGPRGARGLVTVAVSTMQNLETYLPRTSPMAEAAIRKLELHKERTELDDS